MAESIESNCQQSSTMVNSEEEFNAESVQADTRDVSGVTAENASIVNNYFMNTSSPEKVATIQDSPFAVWLTIMHAADGRTRTVLDEGQRSYLGECFMEIKCISRERRHEFASTFGLPDETEPELFAHGIQDPSHPSLPTL
nr:hypothetical protein HmN_000793400 [Hymenolepis microstoma]